MANTDVSILWNPPAKLLGTIEPIASNELDGESMSNDSELEVPAFPVKLLPWPLCDYVKEAALALGCDPAYVAVPLLVAAASAIGNTRRVRLKPTWSEPAVIWAAVVGDSGTAKSPALELALKPVWKQQKKLLQEFKAKFAVYEKELKDWAAVPKSERGEPPERPQPCQHCLCLDITIEALAERLLVTPRGTLVAPDELAGWFGSFNQYKSAGADVAHWLSLFGARPLKVDRKTGDSKTVYVPHAAVSVTGTIQPQSLRGFLSPDFFSNGLAARLLLVMPKNLTRQWTESEISPATERATSELFEALYQLNASPASGGSGESESTGGVTELAGTEPVMIDLTPDALELWIAFVNASGQNMNTMDADHRAAHAKLEAYAARFALVFHCIEQAVLTQQGKQPCPYLTHYLLCDAIDLVKWFGDQTRTVYEHLDQDQQQHRSKTLIELIQRNGGRITVRQMQRGSRRYRTAASAVAALQELVEQEIGQWFFPDMSLHGNGVAAFRLLKPENGEVQ